MTKSNMHKKLVKSSCVVFKLCKQTNKQTDKQTYILITILCTSSGGEVTITRVIAINTINPGTEAPVSIRKYH